MRRKLLEKLIPALALLSLLWVSACRDGDTYAERREKENKQINSFLQRGCHVQDDVHHFDLLNVPGNIKVISEEQFFRQDSTTDVTKNEYVLFAGSGVYMQILRKGTGDKLYNGERATVICRFTEFNIAKDSIRASNMLDHSELPDMMNVFNNAGTFTGVFTSGEMYRLYGSSVPSAWLMPLTFLRIGRQHDATSEIAKVRLIVPSTEGQRVAQNTTQPYFYEITYERGR